jgi:hypothetical protein
MKYANVTRPALLKIKELFADLPIMTPKIGRLHIMVDD